MPWLLAASLALHALVLAWPRATPPRPPVIAERWLNLQLQPGQTHSSVASRHMPPTPAPSAKRQPRRERFARQARPRPAPRKTAPQRRRVRHLPVETGRRASALTVRRRAPARTSRPPSVRPTPASRNHSPNLAMRRQARASLARLFMRRFRYPPLAAERGWEGEVRLRVTLAADGRLDRVQLHASSGYALLDRDALRTMRSIRVLPGADEFLHARLELSFRVRYRLTDEQD